MNFQIYQLEKAQALDLLGRIIQRLEDETNDLRDDDLGRELATDTLYGLQHNVEGLRTQLDVREANNFSVAEIASLLRSYDESHSSCAVEYFATYFSNFNTDKGDFLLAAGYALAPNDQLLRTCVHGVDLTIDCCLPCDCGIEVRK